MNRTERFQLSLRPAEASDYGQLCSWFAQKWLTEFWPADWLKSAEAWQQALQSKKTRRFIALVESGKAIGYAQVYHARDVGGGWWPEAKAGEWGFDLFIGEEVFLSSGWGGALIRKLCAYLFENEGATQVFADPQPTNSKMKRSLALQGFKSLGICSTPDGDAEIWRLTKHEWACEKYAYWESSPAPLPLAERMDFQIEKGGLLVMQASYLARRGFCCGNTCRNCPY